MPRLRICSKIIFPNALSAVAVLVALTLVAKSAEAQRDDDAPASQHVTKVYNIADLLDPPLMLDDDAENGADKKETAQGGGFGGGGAGGGGMFRVSR